MALLQGSFAKETYIFKEPTNRRHPIAEITRKKEEARAEAAVAAVAKREEKERAAAVAKREKRECAAAAVSVFKKNTDNTVSFIGLFCKRDL